MNKIRYVIITLLTILTMTFTVPAQAATYSTWEWIQARSDADGGSYSSFWAKVTCGETYVAFHDVRQSIHNSADGGPARNYRVVAAVYSVRPGVTRRWWTEQYDKVRDGYTVETQSDWQGWQVRLDEIPVIRVYHYQWVAGSGWVFRIDDQLPVCWTP